MGQGLAKLMDEGNMARKTFEDLHSFLKRKREGAPKEVDRVVYLATFANKGCEAEKNGDSEEINEQDGEGEWSSIEREDNMDDENARANVYVEVDECHSELIQTELDEDEEIEEHECNIEFEHVEDVRAEAGGEGSLGRGSSVDDEEDEDVVITYTVRDDFKLV